MDILWAPWRMKYIEYTKIEKSKTCFICEAIATKKPEEKLVLYKGRRSILLMNLFPYNTGHLLAAPLRHVSSFNELSKDDLLSLQLLLRSAINLLEKTLNPDGFNIGINLGRTAGAGLEEHLHIHIVPRWNGDTNFMPVIMNTKVIPEALQDTFRKLRAGCSILED